MQPNVEEQTDKEAEARFKLLLLEKGILKRITPPLSPEDYRKNRRLIPIVGKPVSEIILEDRR